MHYVLPTEAVALQRAGKALRDMRDRFDTASFPVVDLMEMEGMNWTERQKRIREATEQARVNAKLAEVTSQVWHGLLNVVAAADVQGCEVARQTADNWSTPHWTGPQFGVKDRT